MQDRRGAYVSCSNCPWRRGEIFRSLSAADLAALHGFKKDHVYLPAGRTLIRRGLRQPMFYTVFEGWAIRYTAINGGRQISGFCLPGDLLGVEAALIGQVPYVVQTLTDASFCAFESEEFETLFLGHPRLGLELTRAVATSATMQDVHIASVGRRSAEARVAYLLAELYTRLAQRQLATDHSCVLPLTQEHIADALGLSTVHVSRMLKVLNDDKLARFDRGRLTIFDFAGLCDRAEISSELDLPQPSLL